MRTNIIVHKLPNKALLADNFSAALQNFRRARRYNFWGHSA